MTARSNRRGLRGYIAARDTGGRSAPQHIQQLVIRDYCSRIGKDFLLSATEYRMTGCTMVLDGVLDELDQIEGIALYSIFLLPQARAKRMQLYRRLIDTGATLHTAVESMVIATMADAMRIEDLFLVWDIQARQQPADYAYLTQWDAQHATT